METLINKNIDEKIFCDKSNKGIRVFFMPKEGFTKKYAVFSTDFGSVDLEFKVDDEEITRIPEGIAHFLEHKLFEDENNSIFDQFSDYGANVNAFTSFNQTSYLFNTVDNFYECLELLVKFVQDPYFTDENVNKEKGIIGQEIKMYEDNPSWRVMFNCLKAMYKHHPIKKDIAGTIETIDTIDKETLYKAYETFYNPSNMILFVVGDLEFDKVMETVNKVEREFKLTHSTVKRIFKDEPEEVHEKFIEDKMMTSKPIFYFGLKDHKLGLRGEDAVRKDIITNIIHDMLFSPSAEFYNELYNDGLIDNSFGSYFTGKENYGHSIIVGQSNEVDKIQDRIIKLINSKAEDILNEEDFLRIKKKTIGDFVTGFDSIEFIANTFTELYFDGFNMLNFLDILEEVKYDEVLDRFNEHFIPDKLVLSLINPLD